MKMVNAQNIVIDIDRSGLIPADKIAAVAFKIDNKVNTIQIA